MKPHPLVSLSIFYLLIALIPGELKAQKIRTDKKLKASLEELVRDFRGTAGIYVYHLKTGKEAAINADTLFPTASIVKVPILVGVFDKIKKGELSYHQPLIYHDSIKYGGAGLM